MDAFSRARRGLFLHRQEAVVRRAVEQGLIPEEEGRRILSSGDGGRPAEDELLQRGLVTATQAMALANDVTNPAVPLPGRYEILGELGRGGMAVVYRARDRSLGRDVALKFLRTEFLDHPSTLQRMIREARVVAGLNHPNIVRLHDIGEEARPPYLVMELVAGRTLDQAMADPSWKLPDRIAALEQAARALHEVHQLGVVHRDVKPGNIMIESPSGRAVVMDFGLARVDSSDSHLTRTGAVIGTPRYMAPEQIRGDPDRVSPRTDVYALGAILYEMLTGRPPHPATQPAEMYARILRDEPVAPRARNASAPHDLESICLKAIEKEAAHRYPSAGAMADDLHRFLSGEPVQAASVSALRRFFRRVGRNRPLAMSATVVAAVLGVSVILVARERERTRQRAEATQDLWTISDSVQRGRDNLRRRTKSPAQARRDLESALSALDAHETQWPGDPRTPCIRARARIYLGDLDGAEADSQAALTRAGDLLIAWNLLGMIHLERYVQQLFPSGPFASAGAPPRLLEQAQDSFRRGWKPGLERAEVERWGLPWTPEDEVLQRLSEAFRLKYVAGDETAAIRSLETAFAEYHGGEYALWLGRWSNRGQDQIRWYSEAVARAPGDERAHFGLGLARFHAKEYGPAAAEFTEALTLRPDYLHARYMRGVANATVSQYDTAMEDLQAVIRLRHDYAPAWMSLGLVRFRRGHAGDTEAAIELYDRALKFDRRLQQAWLNRGAALGRLGDYGRAKGDFLQATGLLPEDPSAWTNLGIAHAHLGEHREAVAALDRSLTLRPRDPEALARRGECRFRLDDLAGAQSDLEAALTAAPPGWEGRAGVHDLLEVVRARRRGPSSQ